MMLTTQTRLLLEALNQQLDSVPADRDFLMIYGELPVHIMDALDDCEIDGPDELPGPEP